MVHCCEGTCKNNTNKGAIWRSRYPGRTFSIRYYQFPDPDVFPDIYKRWAERVQRPVDHARRTWSVCSDHFSDADFLWADFTKANLLSKEYPKLRVMLKQDAVPNTDLETGEFRVEKVAKLPTRQDPQLDEEFKRPRVKPTKGVPNNRETRSRARARGSQSDKVNYRKRSLFSIFQIALRAFALHNVNCYC